MYFLAETMGRSAGWLAYGAAIAGEASLVISVEDIDDELMTEETSRIPRPATRPPARSWTPTSSSAGSSTSCSPASRKARNSASIVLAEGLAEYLPVELPPGVPSSTSTGTSRSPQTELAKSLSKLVEAEYQRQTGRKRARDGRAARLRGPLRAAARVRRHARQPARRRRLPRPGRERPRRRHGLGRRPAQPQLRPVRGARSTPRPWSPSSGTSSRVPTSSAWRGSWRTTRTTEPPSGSRYRPPDLAGRPDPCPRARCPAGSDWLSRAVRAVFSPSRSQ